SVSCAGFLLWKNAPFSAGLILGIVFFGGRGNFLYGLGFHGGGIRIARLDLHVAVFPQRRQISAHARLHFCFVEFIADFGFDFVEWLLACLIAFLGLQN